jgi:hypothetical protein
MKSERAKQAIRKHQFDDEYPAVRVYVADTAVELAEEDAEIRQKAEDREKAIKALCNL